MPRAAEEVCPVVVAFIALFVCSRSLNAAFVFVACAVFALEDSVAACDGSRTAVVAVVVFAVVSAFGYNSVVALFVCAGGLNAAFVFVACAVFALDDSVAAVCCISVASGVA